MHHLSQRSSPLPGFSGGTEWMIDASGCAADALTDLGLIASICEQVIADLRLTVIGDPKQHRFPGPGGVTAMYLLSESHLTCHTYPEHAFATFNLYCCRRRPAWSWHDELGRRLGAENVMVRELHRDLQVQVKESMQ